MSKTISTLTATVSLLGLVACGNAAQAQTPMSGQPNMPIHKMPMQTKMQGGMMHGKLSMMDQKFMKNAAIGGMFEVRSSQLALKKSKRSDVRQFAQMMIDAHSAVNQQLKQLARSKGVALPTVLDKSNQMTYNILIKASGASFDNAYLKAQHQAHVGAVDLLQNGAVAAKDPDARSFAQTHLPDFRQHMEMASNLRNGGGMSMAHRDPMDNMPPPANPPSAPAPGAPPATP